MCFSRNHYVEFTDPTYDGLIRKLEEYLNSEFASTFRVSMSTSDRNLKHYFIVEDLKRPQKLIIYFKLKLIKNKKIQLSDDYMSRISLLTKTNNVQQDYYRLTINTRKIVHKMSV